MNALLNRAHVALVSFIICLTHWASVEVGAAEALPSTLIQLRTHQLAKVNAVSASLYRTPHDYFAVQEEAPIVATNVTFSAGLSPDGVVSKLREVAFQLARLATNFPSEFNNPAGTEFLLIATAKEADIPTIFPEDGGPATTLEMAGVNGRIFFLPNGSGGFKLPDNSTAEGIPVYLSPYVFLSFPDLKYFNQGPALPWEHKNLLLERSTSARIFTGNPDGSVSEVQSKGWGSSVIDRTKTGDMSLYGDYAHVEGVKLLRLPSCGRIGIHLSLITNGTPAVLALEAANGTFPRYWLPTGQPIVSPMITGFALANNMPRIGVVGLAGQQIVVESSTALFSSGATWVTEMTVSSLPQSGIFNYFCPVPANAAGASNRFWRVRVIP